MLVIRDLGLLVTAALDARIHIWDLAARVDRDGHGRRAATAAALLPLRMALCGHSKGVIAMTYIPPQRYLVSASYDRTCLVRAPPSPGPPSQAPVPGPIPAAPYTCTRSCRARSRPRGIGWRAVRAESPQGEELRPPACGRCPCY
jgi:hypothetical protein